MFVEIDEFRKSLVELYDLRPEIKAYKKCISLLDDAIRTKNLTAINTEEMQMKKDECCQRLLSDYLGDESLGDVDDILLGMLEYLYERGLLKTIRRAEKIPMSILKK